MSVLNVSLKHRMAITHVFYIGDYFLNNFSGEPSSDHLCAAHQLCPQSLPLHLEWDTRRLATEESRGEKTIVYEQETSSVTGVYKNVLYFVIE